MFFREVVSKFDAISPPILSDRYKRIVLRATSPKAEPTQSSQMHDVMASIKKGGSLSHKHTPAGATIHHIRQRLLSHDMVVVLKAYTLLHYVFRNANHAVFQRLAVKTLVYNPCSHSSRPSRISWTSISSRTSRTTVSDESFHRTDVRYELPIPASVAPDLDPLTAFVVAYATYLSARLRLKAQADFPPVRCTDSGDAIVVGHFEQADEATVIKAADELIAVMEAALAIPFSSVTGTTTSTMMHLRWVLNPTLRLLSRDVFLLWRTTCNTIMRMVSLYFEMEKEVAIQALNVYSRFVATTGRAAKVFPILAKLLPRWQPPTHTISLDLAPSMREYVRDVNSNNIEDNGMTRHSCPHEGRKFEKGGQTDSMETSEANCSFTSVGLQDLLYTLPAVMHALEALFSLGANGFPKLGRNLSNNNSGLSPKSARVTGAISEVSSASSSTDSTTSANSHRCLSLEDSDKKNIKRMTKKGKRVVGNAAVSAIVADVQRLWRTFEHGMERLRQVYFETSGEETRRCLGIYSAYVRLSGEAQSFFHGKLGNAKDFPLFSNQNHKPADQLRPMRQYAAKQQHGLNVAQLNPQLRTGFQHGLDAHLHRGGCAVAHDKMGSNFSCALGEDIE